MYRCRAIDIPAGSMPLGSRLDEGTPMPRWAGRPLTPIDDCGPSVERWWQVTAGATPLLDDQSRIWKRTGLGNMEQWVQEGVSFPRGTHRDGRGTDFALSSANATKVELCLFDADGNRRSIASRVRDIPSRSSTATCRVCIPGPSTAIAFLVPTSRMPVTASTTTRCRSTHTRGRTPSTSAGTRPSRPSHLVVR